MQTIYLDISNKGVIPTIHAKQGDVGRKFQIVLTDLGLPYVPASGSAFSVWYSGASGEGNYTEVGDKSAFSANGNKVTVEMIAQMLSNDGDGVLSLVLNDPNGNQISTWNIPYICEYVPGADSQEAKAYYTAFSHAVENLPYPDASLSVSGKAADAAATGKALEGKAPVSHTTDKNNPHSVTKAQVGLGNVPNVATNNQTPTYSAASTLATLKSGEKLATSMGKIMKAITVLISHIGNKSNPHGVTAAQVGARASTWLPTLEEIGAQKLISIGQYTGDLNDRETLLNTVAWVNGNAVTNSPSTAFGVLETWGSSDGIINQRFTTTARCVAVRMYYNGTWTEWEWDNPPMKLGEEYRTTKRHNGKVVYTTKFSFGSLPNAKVSKVPIPNFPDAFSVSHIEFVARNTTTDAAMQLSAGGDPRFFVEKEAPYIINIVVETTGNFSGYTGEVTIEYTKD